MQEPFEDRTNEPPSESGADPNPYATPRPVTEQSIERVELAVQDAAASPIPATTSLQPKPRPRIWTVFAVVLASFVTFMVSSLVMMVIANFVVTGEISPRIFISGDAMRAVTADRVGLLLLLVVPQLSLIVPAMMAAYLSPVSFRKRLSLVRGHWPLWAWVAAAVTTPLVGWISSAIIGSLMQESENLKAMSDIFRGHGESGFLIPLAVLIGLTPAVCEELLFRGYVQTRLNRRLGPFIGILLSSAAFAIFHMDPIHSIAVFPLGLYLGVVAWRSGSLFPAMLGHFVNNSISVFAVVLAPESMDQQATPELALFLLGVLGLGFLGSILTAFAMWRLPIPDSAPLPATA